MAYDFDSEPYRVRQGGVRRNLSPTLETGWQVADGKPAPDLCLRAGTGGKNDQARKYQYLQRAWRRTWQRHGKPAVFHLITVISLPFYVFT
jgi:hypothetical protein